MISQQVIFVKMMVKQRFQALIIPQNNQKIQHNVFPMAAEKSYKCFPIIVIVR